MRIYNRKKYANKANQSIKIKVNPIRNKEKNVKLQYNLSPIVKQRMQGNLLREEKMTRGNRDLFLYNDIEK